MKYLFSLLLIISVLFSCNQTPVDNNQSSSVEAVTISPDMNDATLDSAVQFLLAAAAADFHAHQQPAPGGFRNVHIGHFSSETLYMICGEFLQDKDKWTPFATIRTSGYEQWIGTRALSFCEDSTVVWDETADLSAQLKSRLDALKAE